jgi:hypothetical protein
LLSEVICVSLRKHFAGTMKHVLACHFLYMSFDGI